MDHTSGDWQDSVQLQRSKLERKTISIERNKIQCHGRTGSDREGNKNVGNPHVNSHLKHAATG